jgi:tetrahydromethanopterin S-methyltransferase subunit H
MICDQNGIHGWPVGTKINLPANWDKLLSKAKAKKESAGAEDVGYSAEVRDFARHRLH